MFGECHETGVLHFLRPIERSACSFIPQSIDKEFCEDTLSLENLFKMKIYPTGNIKETAIDIKIGEITKYDYNPKDKDGSGGYSKIDLKDPADTDKIKKQSGIARFANNACDDFVLQSKLIIKYSAITGASVPGFKIESATLDLVYGKITAEAGKTPMIPRVSSVSF